MNNTVKRIFQRYQKYPIIALGNVGLIAAWTVITIVPSIWIWNLVMHNYGFGKIAMRVGFFHSMLILIASLIIVRFVKFNPHPLFDDEA